MNKFYRLVRHDWPLHVVLWLLNWLPDNVPCLKLRGALVRPFLGSCGKNLRLGRNITFYNPSKIYIGRDVYIAYGCWFMAGERITIHDETIFGPYCVIVSSNHTRQDGSFRYGTPQREPIQIGQGCWIAAHVTITAGSVIGDGSLIATQSVVSSQIPAHVMAAGQPAQVIKHYER